MANGFLKHASGRFVVRRSAMRRRLCDQDRHRAKKAARRRPFCSRYYIRRLQRKILPSSEQSAHHAAEQAAGSAAATIMTTAAATVAGTAHRLVVRVIGGGAFPSAMKYKRRRLGADFPQCDLNHIPPPSPVLSFHRQNAFGLRGFTYFPQLRRLRSVPRCR